MEDFGAVEENRAGKLSQDQFETISKMLMQLDFSSSPEAVVIRKGSESFEAEIPNGAEERRLLWVDPDHQRPFPESAAKAWDLCAQVLVQDRPLPVSELDEVFLSVAANDATEPEGIAVN